MVLIGEGTRVRIEGRTEEYSLSEQISAGVYSKVYAARPLDESHAEDAIAIVAKVGHIREEDETTDEAFMRRIAILEDRYRRELQVISGLLEHSGGALVPRAWWGEWAEEAVPERERRIPVLLMRRIGEAASPGVNDWSLGWAIRRARDRGKWLQAEAIATRSGVQYAQMLVLLHQKLKLTCTDRKTGDLFLDPTLEALYVLDWNVVSELPGIEQAVDEEGNTDYAKLKQIEGQRDAMIQSDIRLMATLWMGMLVGEQADGISTLAHGDAESGTHWENVSLGMRRLLLRTRGSGKKGGIADTLELVGAWEEYAAWLEENEYFHYEQARNLRGKADLVGWEQREQSIADHLDLMRRKGAAPDRIAEVEGWLVDKEAELQSRFEGEIDSLEEQIQVEFYEAAAASLSALRQNETLTTAQRLTSSRWYLRARAVHEFSKGSLYDYGREAREPLERFVEHLEARHWDGALQRLDPFLARPEQLTHSVDTLGQMECDLKYHKNMELALSEAVALARRIRHAEEAERALKQLRDDVGGDPVHARLIEEHARVLTPDILRDLRREMDVERATLADREQFQAELAGIAGAIANAAHVKPVAWPAIREQVSRLESSSIAGPTVDVLWSVDRAMQGSMGPGLMDAAESAQRRLEQELWQFPEQQQALSEAIGAFAYALAWQELVRIVQTRPLWPSSIRQGLWLARSVQRSHLAAGLRGQEILGLIATLQAKWKRGKELRAIAGLAKPDDAFEVGAVDDAKVLASFNTAQTEGLELFDGVSVADLLEGRNKARVALQRERIDGHLEQTRSLAMSIDARLTATLARLKRAEQLASKVYEDTERLATYRTPSVAVTAERGQPATPYAEAPPRLSDLVRNRWWLVPAGLLILLLLMVGSALGGYFFREPIGSVLGVPSALTATPTKTVRLPTPTRVVESAVPTESIAKIDRLEFELPSEIQVSDGPTEIRVRAFGTKVDGLDVRFDVSPSHAGSFDGHVATVQQGEAVSEFTPAVLAPLEVMISASSGGVSVTKRSKVVPARVVQTPPQLSLEVSARPAGGDVRPGQTITYTVTVSNLGDSQAVGVQVECGIPESMYRDNLVIAEQPVGLIRDDRIVAQVPPDSVLGPDEDLEVLVFEFLVPSLESSGAEIPRLQCEAWAEGMEDRKTVTGPGFFVAMPSIQISEVAVTPPEAAVGEVVTVTARISRGDQPVIGMTATVTIGSIQDSIRTDASGSLSSQLVLPKDQVGDDVIVTVAYGGVSAVGPIGKVYPALEVDTDRGARVRSEPLIEQGNVIFSAPRGRRFRITGQSADGKWFQVCCVEGNQRGWMSKDIIGLTIFGSTKALPIP